MPSFNLVCRFAAAALSAALAFPLAQLSLPVTPALSADARFAPGRSPFRANRRPASAAR